MSMSFIYSFFSVLRCVAGVGLPKWQGEQGETLRSTVASVAKA